MDIRVIQTIPVEHRNNLVTLYKEELEVVKHTLIYCDEINFKILQGRGRELLSMIDLVENIGKHVESQKSYEEVTDVMMDFSL